MVHPPRRCIGFEYGTGKIYFKNKMCAFGRWEGGGNGLYLLGGASTAGFEHCSGPPGVFKRS